MSLDLYWRCWPCHLARHTCAPDTYYTKPSATHPLLGTYPWKSQFSSKPLLAGKWMLMISYHFCFDFCFLDPHLHPLRKSHQSHQNLSLKLARQFYLSLLGILQNLSDSFQIHSLRKSLFWMSLWIHSSHVFPFVLSILKTSLIGLQRMILQQSWVLLNSWSSAFEVRFQGRPCLYWRHFHLGHALLLPL